MRYNLSIHEKAIQPDWGNHMLLQTALNLSKNQNVCLLLEAEKLEHQNDGVGDLHVFAVADSLSSVSFDKMLYTYSLEASSELDMERFSVEGCLDIYFDEFDNLSALKNHIIVAVQKNLIGLAISRERTSEEVENAFNDWIQDAPNKPFSFEAPDSFNIIDLATETGVGIGLNIEKYFEQKTQ